MENGGEMLQLCRLCLVKDDVNIPIFEEQGDIRQIFLKISSCLPVKVSREDKLPKKICDGCSYKLDMLYEFWNTSANAEKQLLSWLGEAGMNSQMTDGTISAVAQQIKPVETVVKQEEIDPSDINTEENDDDKSYMFQQKFSMDEPAGPSATVTSNDEEPPPPKRARRTAAVKAQIAMDNESDDDDDDSGEPMTKIEDESDESDGEDHEPAFVDVPSTSADDQPGPSGVGKDGVEAPRKKVLKSSVKIENIEGKVEMVEGGKFKKIKTCHICGKIYKDTRTLNKHLTSHSVERPYGCDICDKKFKRNYEVAIHMRVHDNLRSFECDFCSKKLRTKGSWMIHRKRHLKQYVAKCEICTKGFITNQEYYNHMGSQHGTKNHICSICGRGCYSKASLEGHMARHAEDYENNQSIKCDLCNKTFLQEKYLKHHFMRMHKNGGQRFVCDHCGKKVNSKRSLRDHLLIHEGAKPIKCKECGKSFALRTTLNVHMRIHTGDRPYHCPECDKCFTQKGPLTIHMRYHTGERPYVCNACNDTFVSKGALNLHQKNKHRAM